MGDPYRRQTRQLRLLLSRRRRKLTGGREKDVRRSIIVRRASYCGVPVRLSFGVFWSVVGRLLSCPVGWRRVRRGTHRVVFPVEYGGHFRRLYRDDLRVSVPGNIRELQSSTSDSTGEPRSASKAFTSGSAPNRKPPEITRRFLFPETVVRPLARVPERNGCRPGRSLRAERGAWFRHCREACRAACPRACNSDLPSSSSGLRPG